MKSALLRIWRFSMTVAMMTIGLSTAAQAQLQITEIMYDTLANGESVMEWVEVRNLGATDVDLHGAFLDSLGDTVPPPGAAANIRNDLFPGANTIVPAGGVAIIYDSFLVTGSSFNHDESYFRTSWGVPAAASIIPADFWPGLSNSGTDSLGIWADRPTYDMDTSPNPPGFDIVSSFNNALTSVSYGTSSPWPSAAPGHSIQWSGNGSNSDPAQWYESVNGQNGAVTNAPINLPGSNLNSTNDVANPGLLPAGSPPAGLLITEILYNPNSPEVPGNNWEWVEILNNTGSTIDFSATPYWFDDASNPDLPQEGGVTAPNVNTGVVPNGGIAVLFNADGITAQNMIDAWGEHVNFIPVLNYPSLNNTSTTGDTIGLWDNETEYETDSAGTATLFTNAVVSIDYDNNANGWPDDDTTSSIYLTNFGDPNAGSSWVLANTSDGLSYSPNQVTGVTEVHPGGDVGSPGTFVVVDIGQEGDHNGDGSVDAADYVTWRKSPSEFGNEAGYDAWVANFGEGSAGGGGAVPEPACVSMIVIGLAALCFRRRAA